MQAKKVRKRASVDSDGKGFYSSFCCSFRGVLCRFLSLSAWLSDHGAGTQHEKNGEDSEQVLPFSLYSILFFCFTSASSTFCVGFFAPSERAF